MAQRLQQQYDMEYHREQADKELANQLDRGNNPNGAYPPSTSPPPNYGLLEREREMEREREREREREMERERERAMEREMERERERERERQREEDSVMAERLQQEESRRLQRQIERRERRERRGSDDSRGGELEDTRLALQLQEEEIQSAKETIRQKNEEIHSTKESIRLKEEELLSTKEVIRLQREEIQSAKERVRQIRREGDWYQEEGRDEEAIEQDSRLVSRYGGHVPIAVRPPSPPLPAQYGSSPFPENHIPEPLDDSEQPRLKPIPKPRPLENGEDEIPCQFCKKLFKFDTIMSHQVLQMPCNNHS